MLWLALPCPLFVGCGGCLPCVAAGDDAQSTRSCQCRCVGGRHFHRQCNRKNYVRFRSELMRPREVSVHSSLPFFVCTGSQGNCEAEHLRFWPRGPRTRDAPRRSRFIFLWWMCLATLLVRQSARWSKPVPTTSGTCLSRNVVNPWCRPLFEHS